MLLIWHRNGPDDFGQSYADASLPMLNVLDKAQSDAASYMYETTPDVMQAVNGTKPGSRSFSFDTSRLIGLAGNGQDTFSNLWSAILIGKRSITNGGSTTYALSVIDHDFALRIRTALADTARTASLLSAKSLYHTAHYVRALTPPSCGRCVILAGQPSGRRAFERHPHCDCTAVWSTDEAALATHYADANDYLSSLSDDDLAKTLGSEANARAWNNGADLNQLVNAYRSKGSVRPAQIYGRNVMYTTEGTTKSGASYYRMKQAGYVKNDVRYGSKYWRADRPRLMPETIYQIAGDNQAKALELLRNYGWII